MLKKLSALLMMLLCFTTLFSISAYAADMRASEQIKTATASLSMDRNGEFEIKLDILAYDTVDILGASTVIMQRKSGSKWISEYTFTLNNTPELQTENVNRFKLTLNYNPDYTDAEYRAVVNCYAQKDTASSSKTVTSNTAFS